MIAATVAHPGPAARPGLRFGLIEDALAPLAATHDPDSPALTQLHRSLAVVVSAEALFTLIDLAGLDPEDAIASAVSTAATLTRAFVQENPGRRKRKK